MGANNHTVRAELIVAGTLTASGTSASRITRNLGGCL